MEKNKVRSLIIIVAFTILIILGLISTFLIGRNSCHRIAVDFSCNNITYSDETKYKFLGSDISDYICELCDGLKLDSDLVVAILMVENPEFDKDAAHRNDNGTIDVGLFQLNDKYLWSTFKKNYWFENIELDPFNWKQNSYVALHHIQFLQNKMKVIDDVIMSYNCGENAVMTGEIPESTKVYLAKVKNNIYLLKNYESNKE